MSVTPTALDALFRSVDLTGVMANAMLGGVMARGERLDPVGFGTLAIISGLGGGLIRDTLLQHGPPVALTDYAYILTALAGAAVAFFVRVEGRVWNRVFPVLDALALGCWAAAGAQKTLGVGLGWLPAILLGTITAVGGGTLRDVLVRRVPSVLSSELYAIPALVGAAIVVVPARLGTGGPVWVYLGAAACLLIRLLGVRFGLEAPHPRSGDAAGPEQTDPGAPDRD